MHGKVEGKINQLDYNPYLYMYNSPMLKGQCVGIVYYAKPCKRA